MKWCKMQYFTVDEMRQVKEPKMAFVKEGPYAVPVIN